MEKAKPDDIWFYLGLIVHFEAQIKGKKNRNGAKLVLQEFVPSSLICHSEADTSHFLLARDVSASE